ncbi:MAG: zinc ribbon domain-containing protein [Firmicutes bacterium]|nr:zinc ribbon domain-containing protein [Bacillota bacterium]
MPIYEFRCLACGDIFEKLFVDPNAEVNIECPKCKSGSFERVISRTNYVMGSGRGGKNPKVTSKSCSSGNDCMTFEIPGPDD